MTTLPAPPAGAKPGAEEGASTPIESGMTPGDRLRCLAIFLEDKGYTRADCRVITHFLRRDDVYRSGENFESLDTIAQGAGVKVRTVQATVTKLTRAGLMDVRPGIYKGSPVAIRRLRFEGLDAPIRPDPAHSPCAGPRAQSMRRTPRTVHAPVKGIEKRERNANVSAALAGGEGDTPSMPKPVARPAGPIAMPVPALTAVMAPTADPAPIAMPDLVPAPPPCPAESAEPDPAQVERLEAILDAPPIHGRPDSSPVKLDRLARLGAFADLARLAPGRIARFGTTYGTPPAAEPARPRPTPPPCPVPAETVDALIRALSSPAADAKAEADRVADKVSDKLREVKYRPFIKARLRDVADGWIEAAHFARAFDVARQSTSAEQPGSILTKELRRLMGFDGRWKDVRDRPARPRTEARS